MEGMSLTSYSSKFLKWLDIILHVWIFQSYLCGEISSGFMIKYTIILQEHKYNIFLFCSSVCVDLEHLLVYKLNGRGNASKMRNEDGENIPCEYHNI